MSGNTVGVIRLCISSEKSTRYVVNDTVVVGLQENAITNSINDNLFDINKA